MTTRATGRAARTRVDRLPPRPGYWNRPDETAATFEATLADTGEGPPLRTGDLGFLRDGQVYVVGCRKDLIIVRGRNHHPSDLELSAEPHHAAIRPGCVAAFSVDRQGEEVLAIVAEVKAGAGELDAILDAIRRGVVGDHGVEPAVIALVAPGAVPKTSSGKLQPAATRSSHGRCRSSTCATSRTSRRPGTASR